MANNFAGDSALVALYNFESGTITVDSSGKGNTLTNNNTVATSGTCKQGSSSADLETVNSEWLNRTDASLSSGFPCKGSSSNTTFSICGWFRLESVATGAEKAVVSKWGTSGNVRSFLLHTINTTLSFQIGYNSGGSAELLNDSYTGLQTGVWYHVGATYNGSTKAWQLRLWDDGAGSVVHNVSGTATNTVSPDTGPFEIGRRNNTASVFDGLIDEVVITSDVLSITEIDEIRSGVYGSSSESHTGTSTVTGTAAVSVSGKKVGIGTSSVVGNATITVSPHLTGLFATEQIPFATEEWQFGGDTVYGNAIVTGAASTFAIGLKSTSSTSSITGSADNAVVFRKSIKQLPAISGTAAVEVAANHVGKALPAVTGTATASATGKKVGKVNPTVTGTATVIVVSTAVQTDKADIVVTGTASVELASYKSSTRNPAVSGTGAVSATGIKSPIVAPSVTGTGAVTVTVKPRKVGTATVEGEGAISVTYLKTEIVPGVGNPRVQADPLITVVGRKRTIGLPAVTGTGTIVAMVKASKTGATLCLGSASVVCTGYRAILPPGVIAVVGDAQVTVTGIHRAIANLDIRGDPLVAATGVRGETYGNAQVTGNANISIISYNPAQAVFSIHLAFTATPATIEMTATPATVTLTNI